MGLSRASCDQCGLPNPERWLPRYPSEFIVVLGGWSNEGPRATVETSDPLVDQWFQHNEADFTPRAYHGVVVIQRLLYVVGGRKRKRFLRSMKSFDLDKCQWNYHSLLHEARAYVAVAALRGRIYAIGGHNVPKPDFTFYHYH
ncbi:hypothetical protein HPB52_024458 [Rhipicephalus sanguineus]|uniref:Kelch repeat protein n=1 Tax=Rhipicephalus sanguineus TaxID=34632 RepID=A0A9D4TCE2_RHISA|nr:hypothetical protein HPB52_024458 [Rhipicephalus sanguineus]